MADSKNFANSPRSRFTELAGVTLGLAAISASAAWWCAAHGYTLYYGDAEAHLNIGRRILDSRTPGPEQIGTVWLPLPHLMLAIFSLRDSWWHSGFAGVLASAICFVCAGTFLFAAARRVYASTGAALAVALLFSLNANMLYLQATPMTEPLFALCLAALLWATLWFRDSQSVMAMFAAAAALDAAALTRYEGWFLVPFVCLYFLIAAKQRWTAFLFGTLAALAPLAWLAHNRYYYGNPLEFYNGPYSALAINHGATYPGDHDWLTAIRYYFEAIRLAAGVPLLIAGVVGFCIRRAYWPLIFYALAPAFYVWNMHSSGDPIYLPTLPPHSWYNTRFGTAAIPLAAFAAGASITRVSRRWQIAAAIILAAGVALATGTASLCWKESEVNSDVRRAWTREAAQFLSENYRPGSGIIFSFGDLTGVMREAGIPLREGLHEGNGFAWNAAMVRPDLFLREEWALAFAGDAVSKAVQRPGEPYRLRRQIAVKGAAVVEIYHRDE